jgi:hypothetical protein
MEPLARIDAAAREASSGSAPGASGGHAPAHAALAAGEHARAEVLARFAGGVHLVRVNGAAAFVHSAVPLAVGATVEFDVLAPARPALLAAAPPDFAAVLEPAAAGARGGSGALAADVAALLEVGARLPAERLRTLGAGHHVLVEGGRLAVDVTGALPREGTLTVVRAAQPARVEAATSERPSVTPPVWLEPLVRELARGADARVGVGEALLRVAEALRASGARAPAHAALAERLVQTFAPPTSGAELRDRLRELGTRFEARLAALVQQHGLVRAPARDATERTRDDLRVALSRALAAESTPPVLREALARALDSLQASALLAAAREQSGEPGWFALPVADGDRAATAHVRWRREPRREDQASGAATARAVLALELSALGPVRVDVVLADGRLLVRVAVAQDDVLADVRARASDLASELERAGRRVVLGTALEAPERLRLDTDRPPAPGPRGFVDTLG